MEKINFEDEVDDATVEAIFRETAMNALIKLNIAPFTETDLEFARSEKEISKCISLIEEKQRKIKEREARKEKRLAESKKDEKKPKDGEKKQENFKKVFKKAGSSKKKFKRRR